MILWSIQPREVYNSIIETETYRCDPNQIKLTEFKPYYDWLVKRMTERIGHAPEDVTYPVWAWYMWEGERGVPEPWEDDTADNVAIELDVPEDQVLLSDFDGWNLILNDALISWDQDEDRALKELYDSLGDRDKKAMKQKNRERVFDLHPVDNGWTTNGSSIQATMWELKREYIQVVEPWIYRKEREVMIYE